MILTSSDAEVTEVLAGLVGEVADVAMPLCGSRLTGDWTDMNLLRVDGADTKVEASPKNAGHCYKENEVGACMARHRGGPDTTSRFSWLTSDDAA